VKVERPIALAYKNGDLVKCQKCGEMSKNLPGWKRHNQICTKPFRLFDAKKEKKQDLTYASNSILRWRDNKAGCLPPTDVL
jgi:hypothetical protein